jgi:hypothetical protein
LNETPGQNDPDGDDLPTGFETGTSKTLDTNPADQTLAKYSARGVPANHSSINYPGFGDDECYAAGPAEKGGLDGASTINDRAHPGSNWLAE